MKNRIITLTTSLFSMLVLAVGCGGTELTDAELLQAGTTSESLVYVDGNSCVTLYAGQTIDAGQVCATVNGTNLDVTFSTTGGWELTETHLWVGENLSDMPQAKNGNPKVGNFPYNSGDITGATTKTFSLPLSLFGGEPAVCGKNLFVAAHAALRKADGSGGYQTETGWGDGTRIVKRGNWATYFAITLQCETDEPPVTSKKCETAFGWGYTTFIDLGLTDSRWGWEIGPFNGRTGSYTKPIYAGAGQNDITKGLYVGDLVWNYDGSTITVTYNMFSGYTMEETHLYLGTSSTQTIAPGQFGNQHDLADTTTDSYTFSGYNNDLLYMVAHAVVCYDAPSSN